MFRHGCGDLTALTRIGVLEEAESELYAKNTAYRFIEGRL
jgi:hypothetical protein